MASFKKFAPAFENLNPDSTSHCTCNKTTNHLKELLNAEKLDKTGQLESHFKPKTLKPHQHKSVKPLKAATDTESDDIKFVPELVELSNSEDESDSDNNLTIDNKEATSKVLAAKKTHQDDLDKLNSDPVVDTNVEEGPVNSMKGTNIINAIMEASAYLLLLEG
ncbi:hypothetical protein BDQ17DRAFT_1335709 [Cyathus striatus]|nr:hypothetical protein BDQ17DRAFT_1335709 [Cyathus striatus]